MFFLSLAWKLVLVFSADLFGQSAPMPFPGPPPVPVVASECGLNEDRILYSNWGNATINAVCFAEGQQSRQEILSGGMHYVNRVVPLPSNSFYAVSDNRVWRYSLDPWSPFDRPQVNSWRTFGGVAFAPDDPSGWNLSFSFPWEDEGVRFWLNNDGTSYTQPLSKNPRFGCTATAMVKDYEYCLDRKVGTLFQVGTTPFGFKWDMGVDLLAGRRPVNMVAGADERLYVTLATKYSPPTVQGAPSTVEYGKIIVLSQGGRDGRTIQESILFNNVDVVDDQFQDRLAASSRGVYFFNRTSTGGVTDELWFYSFMTKRLSLVLTGAGQDRLSGLAVVPSLQYGRRG